MQTFLRPCSHPITLDDHDHLDDQENFSTNKNDGSFFSWFVIKLLSIQIVAQCVHVFQTLKNGFSNRAYGIMISPLFSFRLFFVSGGTITNDLSTARNRSIIWRHCLCIGNGSGNIARNTNTGIGLMYIYVIFLTIRKKRRL